jgi:hypothetical protein
MTFKMQFDGDNVVAKLKLLPKDKAMRLAGLMMILGKSERKGVPAETLSRVVAECFPKHIIEISGLHAADGEPVSIADLVSAEYFAPLISKMVTALLIRSSSASFTH